jgi:hypothetical protein
LRLVRWEGYDLLSQEVDLWVWGLPPPGPLAFVCEWPARHIPKPGPRSTPGWSWRRPTGPRLSGRQAKHRPSLARQPGRRASTLNRTQQEFRGNRLDPVAVQILVPLDRILHVPRQPLASASQRGQHPTKPVPADAKLGLDVNLELLVGHLGRMTAQDHQDLDGGWGEPGQEPVGEAGSHPARRGPRA